MTTNNSFPKGQPDGMITHWVEMSPERRVATHSRLLGAAHEKAFGPTSDSRSSQHLTLRLLSEYGAQRPDVIFGVATSDGFELHSVEERGSGYVVHVSTKALEIPEIIIGHENHAPKRPAVRRMIAALIQHHIARAAPAADHITLGKFSSAGVHDPTYDWLKSEFEDGDHRRKSEPARYYSGWTPPHATIPPESSKPETQGPIFGVAEEAVTAKWGRMPFNALREAWTKKAREALDLICAAASDELLASSLSKGEPIQALLEVVAASNTLGLTAPAEAMMDSVRYMDELVKKAQGVIRSTGAAALLKISRQALDKRRRQGKLIAIKSRGDWGYPACQFQGSEVLNGLEPILKARMGEDPYVTLEFLLAPEAALDDLSIIEALRKGGDLAQAAREFALSAEGEQYA